MKFFVTSSVEQTNNCSSHIADENVRIRSMAHSNPTVLSSTVTHYNSFATQQSSTVNVSKSTGKSSV